jgi:hypothetical protein
MLANRIAISSYRHNCKRNYVGFADFNSTVLSSRAIKTAADLGNHHLVRLRVCRCDCYFRVHCPIVLNVCHSFTSRSTYPCSLPFSSLCPCAQSAPPTTNTPKKRKRHLGTHVTIGIWFKSDEESQTVVIFRFRN